MGGPGGHKDIEAHKAAVRAAANRRWQEYADILGFSSEREMLSTLYQEWTLMAMADLLGVSKTCVGVRIRRLGIKTRPSGWRQTGWWNKLQWEKGNA